MTPGRGTTTNSVPGGTTTIVPDGRCFSGDVSLRIDARSTSFNQITQWDAAEDLAQEAMARTLARWRRVRTGTNPPGYVYTTAFRLLQRYHRRARPAELTCSPTVERPEAATVANVVLAQALDAMPMAQRAVAALCISLGWTTHEAASALRISPSTARVQLHRARNDLRAALGEPSE